jgi:hypothetical protein
VMFQNLSALFKWARVQSYKEEHAPCHDNKTDNPLGCLTRLIRLGLGCVTTDCMRQASQHSDI